MLGGEAGELPDQDPDRYSHDHEREHLEQVDAERVAEPAVVAHVEEYACQHPDRDGGERRSRTADERGRDDGQKHEQQNARQSKE